MGIKRVPSGVDMMLSVKPLLLNLG